MWYRRLSVAVLVIAIGIASVVPAVAVASASPAASLQELAIVKALPRIKADGQRLYNSATGTTFQPRGVNYVRLRPTDSGGAYHSTFEPPHYDGEAVRAMFAQLRHDGYNLVRAFIAPGVTDPARAHGIGRGDGTSGYVHGPYMDKFADFVRQATRAGIYVMPVLDAFPQNDTYYGIAADAIRGVGNPNIEGDNLYYLGKGHVAAKAEYMKRFVQALISRTGPALSSTILAYETDNEAHFQGNMAPFHQMSGTVTTHNGVTYNMADPAQRQRAADESLVAYARRMERSVSGVDPAALVTMGFFTNNAVGKTDFNGLQAPASVSDRRFPGRPAAVARAGAVDFIDMHHYGWSSGYNAAADLESSERSKFRKPYIVGEFGAVREVHGQDVRRAAIAMRDQQIATCRIGAQGWTFWTYDTNENLAGQRNFFTMIETSGAINGQLAPIVRRDPCR